MDHSILETGDCTEAHRTGVWAASILELCWVFKVLSQQA